MPLTEICIHSVSPSTSIHSFRNCPTIHTSYQHRFLPLFVLFYSHLISSYNISPTLPLQFSPFCFSPTPVIYLILDAGFADGTIMLLITQAFTPRRSFLFMAFGRGWHYSIKMPVTVAWNAITYSVPFFFSL